MSKTETMRIGILDYDVYHDDDLYCPFCGKQQVVIGVGDGDYYVGPMHYCLACKKDFRLP